MDEMLHPSKIGVVFWRNTELPSHVILQKLSSPIAVVERWICDDEVRSQILVFVVQKTSLAVPLDQVRFYPSNGQVHFAEAPSCLIALLAVDRNVADLSAMSFYEFLALNKHPTRAAARIKDSALVRLKHLSQESNDAPRGVELTAFLAFGGCKLP